MAFPLYLFSYTSAIAMLAALLLQLLLGVGGKADPPFNNPPGVDIWCGKAYRASNSSFDPGGRLSEPARNELGNLYLHMSIYPEKSYYLASEKSATFIVDNIVTDLQIPGQPYLNKTVTNNGTKPFTDLTVRLIDPREPNKVPENDVFNVVVPVNSTGFRATISLDKFPALRGKDGGYSLSGLGLDDGALQTFWSYTILTVLPDRNDTGSTARIDNVHGGLEVKSSLTQNTWQPIFPYSFYTSWDWIASTINNSSSPKKLSTFRALGYNIIHPVPPGGPTPFDPSLLEQFLTLCDSLSLYVMYDLRHTYTNLTSLTTQLAALQPHPSLLLYYTADEPDGSADPLSAPYTAYKALQTLDPHHPVSLVLNCQNFYFADYASGADILLEDTYPLAANTSFSSVYNTPCNDTYGDCGCDACHANDPAYPAYVHNPFLDISRRVDALGTYQDWLGWTPKKPVWGVPQAFYDAGSFWSRWATGAEEAVMQVLRVNHGAKGVVGWIYPTSEEIEGVTGELARALTTEEGTGFLLKGERRVMEVYQGDGLVDAVAWIRGGEALVSIVYQGYGERYATMAVSFAEYEIRMSDVRVVWGTEGWSANGGPFLETDHLAPLQISIFKVKLS
ncbi:hypothetical protein EJ04DRAFT_580287 [Polyplosphaeria fusca]|uniref:Uncharacterized protein n=1 Tax=Polyplosphaeria fusca TaxID=682080 RepID=A0A9P4UYD4_9PLEO|nr:hypothetical protein EJ04DRAFT_580287 [Polyplosphaeria fusca]